jgi:cell pole-organizing protein PopZ
LILWRIFVWKALEAMSAINPISTPGDSHEARRPEPSMEEILASIRRIIADDQALFTGHDAPRIDGRPTPDAGAEAPDFGAVPGYGLRQQVEAESLALHPEAAPQPSAKRPNGAAQSASRMVSSATEASTASAFHALVASRFAQNSEAILALTRDALRPMLEAWLDKNLPALVERLVRAEIERIALGD